MIISPFPRADLDLSFSLRALIGHVGAMHLRGVLSLVLMMLVRARIEGLVPRLERLVARFRAGTLRTVSVRVLPVGVSRPERAKVARVWPVRFGWLVARGGWQVAAVTSWMETILAAPEMQALLVAAPQARRMLLPVCRALAVPVHLLRPGTFLEAKVARARVTRVRPKRPTVAQWLGSHPLPRGVLSAARRQGFWRLPRDWDDVAKWGRGDW